MNYAEIEGFLAIVQNGSMTRAAQKLFITQPTLSNRIHALEEELGERLVLRGKGVREIRLTDAGKQFIPIAEKWQSLWKESRYIGAKQERKPIHIAAISSINMYFMPRVYQQFMEQTQSRYISLSTSHSYDIYHRVENGQAHIGFISTTMYAERVLIAPLFQEQMTLVCNSRSSYAGSVSPRQLDVGHEIMLNWCPQFIQWHEYWFGAQALPWIYIDDTLILEQLLEVPESWAVVPVSIAEALCRKETVRQCALQEAPADRIIYLLTHPAHQLPKETAILLEQMHSAVRQYQGISWLYSAGV